MRIADLKEYVYELKRSTKEMIEASQQLMKEEDAYSDNWLYAEDALNKAQAILSYLESLDN